MTLRVAVIGMGPIGNRHADMYKSDALAELVADPYSNLYRDFDGAAAVMKELLFTNPAAVHYIPVKA